MKLNNKGSILIIAYIGLYALITLTAAFAVTTFMELNNANRYRDSVTAFWLAEAGIQRFIHDSKMLDEQETLTFEEGRGQIILTKDDSRPMKRIITSTGIVGGSRRSVQIEYPALPPEVFENALSVNGDFVLKGKKSMLMINDKLRLRGNVIDDSRYSSLLIEDMKQMANSKKLAIRYPDANRNGVEDEFEDFIAFNRSLIEGYAEEEVVYLQGNGTFTVTPNRSLEGKKIIYIEGREGKGDVLVQFSGAWADHQNVTVISTGTVTLNQAGEIPSNSQLNIIAWSGYNETAILPSIHRGMIFTHGKAKISDIHDTSITYGSLVANEGVEIGEIWSTKTFNYADMRLEGNLPPGFEGLIGTSKGYMPMPKGWQEVF